MAEKIIPDVDFFAQEIAGELKQDLPSQGLKVAENLINFPPEKMNELHLQDWYSVYWSLLNLFQYMSQSPDKIEKSAEQILARLQGENNSTRKQYFALALMLFGRVSEFQALADKNLWSKNLREDFDTFSKFNQLIGLSSDLETRSNIRRNSQIKKFLAEKYADLIKKYSAATLDKCPKVPPKNYQIYFCWLQGEENLPPIVQCCYNSLKMNAGRYQIVFIDENNYSKYVDIPDCILQKFMVGGGVFREHIFQTS